MELEIWLNQLARVEPNQQETVIQFLERVSYQHNMLIYLVPFLLRSSHVKLRFALALGIGETCEQFLHLHR